jgi:hypothetical protein
VHSPAHRLLVCELTCCWAGQEINQLQQVRFGIEQQIMVLEQANVSKDTVAAMKTGRDALKQAQADLAIDDVSAATCRICHGSWHAMGQAVEASCPSMLMCPRWRM